MLGVAAFDNLADLRVWTGDKELPFAAAMVTASIEFVKRLKPKPKSCAVLCLFPQFPGGLIRKYTSLTI